MRPLMTISKLPVLISSIYYLFTFAWVVGINNTLAILVTPLYGFGIKQIGRSSLPGLAYRQKDVESDSEQSFQGSSTSRQ